MRTRSAGMKLRSKQLAPTVPAPDSRRGDCTVSKKNHSSSQKLPKSRALARKMRTRSTGIKLRSKQLAPAIPAPDSPCNGCTVSYKNRSPRSQGVTVLSKNRTSAKRKLKSGRSNVKARRSNEIILKNRKDVVSYDNLACTACQQSFQTLRTLEAHVCYVDLNKEFSCEICGKTLKTSKALTRHREKHKNKFECSQCGAQFNFKSSLNVHIKRIHAERKEFPCEYCSGSFMSRSHLTKHLKIHLGAYLPYRCHLCDATFATIDILRQHMKMMHPGVKSFKCPECPASFAMHADMCSHIKRHARNFTCGLCHKTFSRKINLRDHIATHTGVKPHQCHLCQKRFSSKNGLAKHITKVHLKIRRYACTHCEKRFDCRSKLQKHTSVHTGERTFSCDRCPRKFVTKFNLEMHQRIHSDLLPYECTFCEKKFRHKSSLIGHIRSHTGEKPYKCDRCDVRYKDQSSLAYHMRKHSGRPPYVCNKCSPERIFSAQSALRKHTERMHSDGIRGNFRCTTCPFTSACLQSIRAHAKLHGTTFICDVCQATFSRKLDFNRHLKTHARTKSSNNILY